MKDHFIVNKNPQPNNIVFMKDKKEVGRLEWDSGKMTFTGNANKAAKIFFDEVRHFFENIRKPNNIDNLD